MILVDYSSNINLGRNKISKYNSRSNKSFGLITTKLKKKYDVSIDVIK